MSHTVKFTKMHGAGNDYIYVYLPENPIPDLAAASVAWSRQHFGIGSDGLIIIDKSNNPQADFMMRIFNNDGSEAKMCGNGIRCVGKFVYEHSLTNKTRVSIDTLSGIKTVELHVTADGKIHSATVDMGEPEVKDEGLRVKGARISMGNPHYVCFVDDVMSVDVASEGSRLEYEAVPGDRCNVEFATVQPDGSIRMRVWERGSGITLACGTGACATAVAACIKGLAGRESRIEADGGTLTIRWREDNHVMMTGPTETVFEGFMTLDD